MVRPLLATLALVTLIGTAGAQQPDDATALAAKVQHRYNGIHDFQGEFVQTYEGGVLRTKTTEQGTVAIKRPGRMRFTYTKPERKEFVSDGVRLYTHLVADKQVIVSGPPRDVIAFPHPIIRHFFLGERGQRAMELLREYPFTV